MSDNSRWGAGRTERSADADRSQMHSGGSFGEAARELLADMEHNEKSGELSPLTKRVRRRVRHDLKGAVHQMVLEARDAIRVELSGKLPQKILKNLQSFSDDEIEVVVDRILRSNPRTQNLIGLVIKEIGTVLIKKSVDRYSVKPPIGLLHPREYFDRSYKSAFILFGIPASSVTEIDPNLHRCLKMSGNLPSITESLRRGLTS
jgi:hypothetical protein